MSQGRKLRVCFLATEMAGFGPYGGFGVLTRDLACALAQRGLELYVVMPRKKAQQPVERLQGVTVLSFPCPLYGGLKKILPYAGLFKTVDADLYHSQEPTILTRLAELAEPAKKHLVTFQDPRDLDDWRKQWAPARPSRYAELKFLYRYRRDVVPAVQKATACYCQARSVIEKATRLYRLQRPPGFLPNPVQLPEGPVLKEARPSVCFLGRWDAIKRPELFLELAARFPAVRFVLAGACPEDPVREADLRGLIAQRPNVEAPGWVDPETRSALLSRSWILINTSTKECLPVSYLEACAHRCAILSHGNADEFASTFGYWAAEGHLEDYVRGLEWLLQEDRWRTFGELGYEYVRRTHQIDEVVEAHLQAYGRALERLPGR